MTTIHTNVIPEWLMLHGAVIGAEGEVDGTPTGTPDGSQGASSDDDASSGDAEHEDSEDEPQGDDGLKSALRKERAARKALEKSDRAKDKALQGFQQEKEARELENKSDLEKERILRNKADVRNEKLSAGYLRSALDREIERAARTLKFADTDDALQLVDRSDIVSEQDADDPTAITVDRKSVEKAVKALADRKKHLLGAGTEDGEPTGSQFGGRKTGGTKKTDAEAYKLKYPGL